MIWFKTVRKRYQQQVTTSKERLKEDHSLASEGLQSDDKL